MVILHIFIDINKHFLYNIIVMAKNVLIQMTTDLFVADIEPNQKEVILIVLYVL